ncbi:MAG: DNA cytosine methyltransferase, partial [Alphaproteobacteria bacterium]|nr:DNA cytosine methyltransferase [Alphaproteobacteria bacterium]
GIGYEVEWRIVVCAAYGDPTSRRRWFLMGRRDGRPIEWPDATHAAPGEAPGLGLPAFRTARDVIDWTDKGRCLFDRTPPLRPSTIRRTMAGAARYFGPFAALYRPALEYELARSVARWGGDATPPPWPEPRSAEGVAMVTLRGTATARSVDIPVPSLTAGGKHLGVVESFINTYYGQKRPGEFRGRTLDEPLATQTTEPRHALVEAFLFPVTHAGDVRTWPVNEPLRTITTARRGEMCLAEPFMAPYYGSGSGLTGHPVSAPLPTITTKARFALVEPAVAMPADCHALAAAKRLAVIDGQLVALHLLYRMLRWKELARATSLDDYQFAGANQDIIKQIGNAVPRRTAAALCHALLQD